MKCKHKDSREKIGDLPMVIIPLMFSAIWYDFYGFSKFWDNSNRAIIYYTVYHAAAGLESDSVMLSTMLHSASRDAPILVWACTHTKGDRAVPAVEVANMLKLMQLTQPWKVSSISLLAAH